MDSPNSPNRRSETPQSRHLYARQHVVAQSRDLRAYLDDPGGGDDPDFYFHRIGVWNIENLSPTRRRGFPELRRNRSLRPRTDQQLETIAQYLDEIGPDALVVTEIDPDLGGGRSSQLETILNHLGDEWAYELGSEGGGQRIGLIYDKNRVRVKQSIEMIEEEYNIQGSDIADRDPLVWWVELLSDGEAYNDLLIVGLHLKSQQRNVHNHMAAVAKVFGDLSDKTVREELGLPSVSVEPEVAILGDMNDSAHRRRNFKFIFDYARGLGYTHLGSDLPEYPGTRVNGSEIDHVFVSEDLVDLVVQGSFRVHGVTSRSQIRRYRETFSDHFPVTFDLINYTEE